MELCHIVERLGAVGQAMGLAIIHHLQPMFDGAIIEIGVAQRRRLFRRDPPLFGQRRQRINRRRGAQHRVAPTVNHLVDLGEEFAFTNAATPALQIIAGAELLTLCIMVADAVRDAPDLANRPEIERPSPDERAQLIEEILPELPVACGRSRSDECRALPWQGHGFIIIDRRFDRQRDRRGLWRGP